jgi:hypothetical protein
MSVGALGTTKATPKTVEIDAIVDGEFLGVLLVGNSTDAPIQSQTVSRK